MIRSISKIKIISKFKHFININSLRSYITNQQSDNLKSAINQHQDSKINNESSARTNDLKSAINQHQDNKANGKSSAGTSNLKSAINQHQDDKANDRSSFLADLKRLTFGAIMLNLIYLIIDKYVNKKIDQALDHLDQLLTTKPINSDDLINISITEKLQTRSKAESYLANNHQNKIIAIVGVTGSGKTCLATNFAIKYLNNQTQQKTIYYFNAKNNSELKLQYRQFAKRLGISYSETDNDFENIQNQVNQQLKLRPNWLLIFDDVTDVKSLESYLPKDLQQGKVIFTTNQQIDKQKINNVKVTYCKLADYNFTDDEVVNLISNYSNNQLNISKINCQKLANRLAHLPLAIKKVIAYLQTNHRSANFFESVINYRSTDHNNLVTAYLKNFQQQIAFQDQSIYQAINNLAISKVSINSQNLLPLLISLNPVNIDLNLLAKRLNIKEDQLDLIINELNDYRLIEYNHNFRSIKVDQTIESAIKTNIELKNQLFIDNINFFSQQLSANNTKQTKDQEVFISHAKKLLTEIEDNPKLVELINEEEQINNLLKLSYATSNYCTSINSDAIAATKFLTKAQEIFEQKYPSSAEHNSLKSSNPRLIDNYAKILYSIGRIYFFNPNKITKAKSIELLNKADEYTRDLIIDQKLTFTNILVKRNGTLYHNLESKNDGELLKAKQQYQKLSNDPHYQQDEYHQQECKRQLSKCNYYLALNQSEITKKAKYLKEALDDACSLITSQDRRTVNDLNQLSDIILELNRIGEFDQPKIIQITEAFSNLSAMSKLINQDESITSKSLLIAAKKLNKQRSVNYPDADTNSRLAHLYYNKNNNPKALKYLDRSLIVQDQLQRPSNHHTTQDDHKFRNLIQRSHNQDQAIMLS